MNIAFIGHGQVGGALAVRLHALGHAVTLATNDLGSDSLRKVLARQPALRVAEPRAAVEAADLVCLATPFGVGAEALAPLAEALRGKVLVDCTNPVGPGLTHGLDSRQSGTQWLQALLPDTRVAKAFTIYGFENLDDPHYPGYGVRPAMLFCGDDAAAKATLAGLIDALGYEPVDVGGTDQALHLEHMTLLWARRVRLQGASPNLVWAALRR